MTNPSPSQHPHPLENTAPTAASASGTGQPARTGRRLLFWRSPDHQARTADKHRYQQIRHDEKAERRRYHDKGLSNPTNPQRSWGLTIVTGIFALYGLLPFAYLIINATKTQADFTSTFGLGFGHTFALWDNITTVFTYQNGIFARWLLNTILYVVIGAGGATLLSIMGGYALAKYRFPGRKAIFILIIGSISVPGIALAVPQFLLFAKLGLTNTPLAMIIPSLISPFGLYLMWIFSDQAIPPELIEAARVDGASEWRTLWQIALPLLTPGIVTTSLFTIVATWNNYFLPPHHDQRLHLVPPNHRTKPMERPSQHRRRPSHPKPRHHRQPTNHHPPDHRLPHPPKILAKRPHHRSPQTITHKHQPQPRSTHQTSNPIQPDYPRKRAQKALKFLRICHVRHYWRVFWRICPLEHLGTQVLVVKHADVKIDIAENKGN